jgi:4-hydroxythreonine-4-phosphate dehydrogenase
MRPRIAVTLGDPRGIGPEVAFAATSADAGLTFFGPDPFASEVPTGNNFVGIGTSEPTDVSAGTTSALAIERAVEGALRGDFHAIVTAPVHKPSLHAAGWDVPGQTEMLQRLTSVDNVGMLMAAETTRLDAPLRVLLATTHHALRDVPELVTSALVVEQTTLLAESLERDWGIGEPRVAVCALNPHASDGGLFGNEEAERLMPAVKQLKAAGWNVEGPLPADTVFQRALQGHFHAVVAPYHDVGMAAFKTVSFGSGVNVTLGLPFIRTSPDHGTAFDIAGTGCADASSMKEAITLARRLAAARFDTDSADV